MLLLKSIKFIFQFENKLFEHKTKTIIINIYYNFDIIFHFLFLYFEESYIYEQREKFFFSFFY